MRHIIQYKPDTQKFHMLDIKIGYSREILVYAPQLTLLPSGEARFRAPKIVKLILYCQWVSIHVVSNCDWGHIKMPIGLDHHWGYIIKPILLHNLQ